MPAFEDTIQGSADVSGLAPVGNPKVSQANMDRKVNRAGAPPEAKPAKQGGDQESDPGADEASADAGDDGAAGSGASKGGPAGDIYSSLAGGGANTSHLNPLAPYDWGKQAQEDLGTAYHATRRVADHLGAFLTNTGTAELPGDAVEHIGAAYSAAFDPNAIRQSIQNIWSQDTAQAHVAQFLLGGKNAEGIEEAVLPTALTMGANPLNAVGGEGSLAYRGAAIVGPQLAQAFASTDPHERTSALTWAAVTGTILSAGHLKVGAKELAGALGRWPEMQKQLTDLFHLRTDVNRRTAEGESKAATDYVRHYLSQGGITPSISTVKKAATEEERSAQQLVKDEEGQLHATGGPRQRQRKALKNLGVQSVDELMSKVGAGEVTGGFLGKLEKNWKNLDLGYDLERQTPGDRNLGSPLSTLREIHNSGDAGRAARAYDAMSAFSGVLEHMKEGLWSNGSDPWRAQIRALAGHNRRGGATDTLFHNWVDHAEALAGHEGEGITRAIANDEEAFNGLSLEGRMVAQQGRVIFNAVSQEMERSGYQKGSRGGYIPFLQKANPFSEGKRSAAGRFASPFTTATQRHKLDAAHLGEQGNIFLDARYNAPHEANAEQGARRSTLIADLLNPAAKLSDEVAQSPEAQAIRKLALRSPEEAADRARKLAHDWYGDFETSFPKLMRQWNARSLKAVRTHQVLQNLTEALHKDGRPLAMKVTDADQAKRLAAVEGYQGVRGASSVFDDFVFHPEFHKDVDRLVNTPGGLRDVPVLKHLTQIEGKSVGYIMYSPLVHSLNVAGRMTTAALMNPIEMTHYFMRGHALTPEDHDIEAMRLRARARSFGFIPDMSGKSYFDQLSGRMDAALGHESDAPEEVQAIQKGLGLRNVPEQLQHAHQAMNDWFWNWYRDFGVMMFHLEEQGALKHGFNEQDAGIWAAERAKTWVGLANPEDHAHPVLHDAARLALFAPEWWKSWAKLMVPVYRNTGMSESHAAYATWQGAKFVSAALATQKMAGNLLNFYLTSSAPWAMDGHMQSGNLAGNQDRIEATAPWLDSIPGFSALAPRVDPKTGGRRTFENPLARQAFDTEEAGGLQTAFKDWRPQDMWDGATKVAAARMSPLLEGTAALGNIDLYRSLTSNSMAHVNPNQSAGIAPQNLAYAALMMSPAGSQWAEKMGQDASVAADQTQGPFGARVPKAMQAMVGDSKTAAERLLFTWLTGVNAPYDRAPKTRGTPISDADYQRFQQAKTHYAASMQTLSAQGLGGQITPSQWLTSYKQAHGLYTQSLGAFATAPQYVGGTDGLVNDWYGLDQKATNPSTGEVDHSKLTQLQAQFRQQHSQAQWSDLQHELIKNDSKYPMLGLYHRTLDARRKWQDSFAQEHGIDPSTLRQQISEYGALYGQPQASARYLQTHRDLATYEAAKKRQFDTSPAGLMYGLFYNSPSVSAYMQARHLSPEQVIKEQGSE